MKKFFVGLLATLSSSPPPATHSPDSVQFPTGALLTLAAREVSRGMALECGRPALAMLTAMPSAIAIGTATVD